MQPEITIHDYPCGSGETTAMIKSFQEDRKYLVILPLLSEVDRVVETKTKVRFSQPAENDNFKDESFRQAARKLIDVQDIPAISKLKLSYSGQEAGLSKASYRKAMVNSLQNLRG